MGYKVTIEHRDSDDKEFGYGNYICGIVAFDWATGSEIAASECVSKNANDATIKAAEKRVRARAHYWAKKWG
jgi:hypothetical protein